ncbi:hypothetical protein IAT38_003453 [Cryptococcus sp. DSM 104549]
MAHLLDSLGISAIAIPEWVRSSSTGTIILYGVGALVSVLAIAYLYMFPYQEYRLHFRHLQGPANDNWFLGVLPTIIKAPPNVAHGKWAAQYGPTYRYRVFFGLQRFYTADPVALSYILSHPDVFPKPAQARKGLREMLGNGLLVAEGDDHRKQRKALNPSFSPGAIRGMVPIFYDKAYELREKLLGLVEGALDEAASPTPAVDVDIVEGGKKIDVLKYLGKTTLDVIGIAGFNYDFKSLSTEQNELSDAYSKMFTVGTDVGILAIAQQLIPILKFIPTKRRRVVAESQGITRKVGMKLINDKKRAILAAHSDGLEKGEDIGNDLLSILIKANLASDIKPEQRLTDVEVLDQITTFMLAGNETSSTALTWILYMLALHPESQTRLREEVLAIPDDRPSLETLNTLTYMDAVVREVLRLYAPAPSTIRESTEDCVIPLSMPVIDKNGKSVESVRVNAGTTIFIPILNVNTSPAIWGPDAAQYNPKRFLPAEGGDIARAGSIPGTWGNLLTFLGGSRNCIGYRFALAEIKAILFVLIKGFEFEELGSKPVIEAKASVVMRSRVVGEEKAGLQMPLMVKPLSA